VTRQRFALRVAASLIIGSAVEGALLSVGTVGLHALAGLGWLDAAYDAALIITGNGPAIALGTASAKGFAIVYALLSVVALAAVFGVILAPLVHRVLHTFHADLPGDGARREGP
jgi:hypothetical protein